jgi:hypothetical protein
MQGLLVLLIIAKMYKSNQRTGVGRDVISILLLNCNQWPNEFQTVVD